MINKIEDTKQANDNKIKELTKEIFLYFNSYRICDFSTHMKVSFATMIGWDWSSSKLGLLLSILFHVKKSNKKK